MEKYFSAAKFPNEYSPLSQQSLSGLQLDFRRFEEEKEEVNEIKGNSPDGCCYWLQLLKIVSRFN